MKKIIAVIFALILCISLCSCGEKSLEDQLAEARRQSEVAKSNADAARKNYNDLKDAIDRYEDLREQIENAG